MKAYPVLVVDDDPAVRETLECILRDMANVIPVCVSSGAQALKELSKVKPGLILLDMKMPEMDGYEVIRELRANPETKDIPVIAVTASGTWEQVKAAGADDHIAKPFSLDTVVDKVAKHLVLESVQPHLEEVVEGAGRQIGGPLWSAGLSGLER